eukprot:TRINITY_DN51302_c0_g1_i1.p1 TRINITY_DN51302_c0_g1~~TRINITY_DN51302_c0_g1_i1.p1  ORF type:complete len:462 (+),score=108.32 TRINITY_DN51302_c0_g1_i1:67-1452(+)
MEFDFDVAKLLGAPGDHEGPYVGCAKPELLRSPEGEALVAAVEALTECSAKVRFSKYNQDLRLPKVTETVDSVYIAAEGRNILGFARVGLRAVSVVPPGEESSSDAASPAPVAISGGYGAFQSKLQSIRPCSLMDIHVVESLQRRGLGRLLLDEILQGEGNLHPAQVVYYAPSDMLLELLKKHAGLAGGKIASRFVIFDEYFDEAKLEKMQRKPLAEVVAKPKAKKAFDENDEGPSLEEVEEQAKLSNTNPLDLYKKDEDEFYTQRTKLFCFNGGEWQDAGVGGVHLLLQAQTGRTRLIFQQEGSQRIIANHFLANRAGQCQLETHAGNEKTWVWTAQTRVEERRFALKFQSKDLAIEFKVIFEKAKAATDAVEYTILRKLGATADKSMNSRHVKLMTAGTVVKVHEVVYNAEEQRVRAKVLNPSCWITVLSHNPADVGSYAVMLQDLNSYTSVISESKPQ